MLITLKCHNPALHKLSFHKKLNSMKNELLPTTFPGINNEVYGDLWTRIAAKLIDFVVMLPVAGLILYINGLSKSAYFYAILPNLAIYILYDVYLVKRYGGTPGKLLMGLKIVQKNGDDVDWHASFMRYIVTFCLSISGIFIMLWSLSFIDDTNYVNMGFFKRMQILNDFNPFMSKIQTFTTLSWILAGIIAILSNKRKRAIHDFIAGTVVVKSIYLNKMREITEYPVVEKSEK